jgi:hypothetical protein
MNTKDIKKSTERKTILQNRMDESISKLKKEYDIIDTYKNELDTIELDYNILQMGDYNIISFDASDADSFEQVSPILANFTIDKIYTLTDMPVIRQSSGVSFEVQYATDDYDNKPLYIIIKLDIELIFSNRYFERSNDWSSFYDSCQRRHIDVENAFLKFNKHFIRPGSKSNKLFDKFGGINGKVYTYQYPASSYSLLRILECIYTKTIRAEEKDIEVLLDMEDEIGYFMMDVNSDYGTEGELIFPNKTLEDHDGVATLPRTIIKILEENGIVVSDNFKTYTDVEEK